MKYDLVAAQSDNGLLVAHRDKLSNLAKDVAMVMAQTSGTKTTYSEIATVHEIPVSDLEKLLGLEVFQSLVKLELDRRLDMGPFGDFRIRSEMLASDLQERIYKKAIGGAVEDKDAIKFLEILLKNTGINESVRQHEEVNSVPPINVTVNVPVLNNPKLRHVESQGHIIDIDHE